MNVDNEIAKIAKRRGCTLAEAKAYALEIGVKRLATIAKFRKEHPDYAAKAKAKPAKAKPAKAKPAAKAPEVVATPESIATPVTTPEVVADTN